MFLIAVFWFFFVFDTSESSTMFKPGMTIFALPMLGAVAMGVVITFFSGRLAARTTDGAQALAMAPAYRNTLRDEPQAAKSVDQAVAPPQSKPPWVSARARPPV